MISENTIEERLQALRGVVVVVEDYLSAIRVGRLVPTLCITGTWVANRALALTENYTHKLGWFDPDRGGEKAWSNLRKKVTLLGHKVSQLTYERDPKYASNFEIAERVLGATGKEAAV